METAIEKYKKMGYTVEIHNDPYPDNPRDWDNLSVMVCFHGRYGLGDKAHGYNQNDFNSWGELKKQIKKDHNPVILLPLYMYDHSGITIRTTPFDCHWDSGQIGFVFIPRLKALIEYGGKIVSAKMKGHCQKVALDEVDTYDKYLRGEMYGFIVRADGEEIESCWGFFDLEEAKADADIVVDVCVAKAQAQLK